MVEGKQSIDFHLLESSRSLCSFVVDALHEKSLHEPLFQDRVWNGTMSSSVMLLLGERPVVRPGLRRDDPTAGPVEEDPSEICIILNKRSKKVRQAGDLCCPGGMVEPQLDPYLARLLLLPCSPLARWAYWPDLLHHSRHDARLLSLLLATSLRESWEEMRLNPLLVRFLGPLPSQRLLLFPLIIHPMVGWVSWQKRFFPSWEVEKILWIPLRSLLDRSGYARYRLSIAPRLAKKINRKTEDLPCFLYRDGEETELLWGATYRIVTGFIETIFGFEPPELATLPLVPGIMDEEYVYGRK